jgi:hypothetical protein
MNLYRWLTVILTMGLILVFNPLGAQAGPFSHFEQHPGYHHPHGKAHGWHGPRYHGRHYGHWKGPRHHRRYVHHAGPPSVVYVQPAAPIIGIPYAQPQPYCPQPAIPGLSGQLNFSF